MGFVVKCLFELAFVAAAVVAVVFLVLWEDEWIGNLRRLEAARTRACAKGAYAFPYTGRSAWDFAAWWAASIFLLAVATRPLDERVQFVLVVSVSVLAFAAYVADRTVSRRACAWARAYVEERLRAAAEVAKSLLPLPSHPFPFLLREVNAASNKIAEAISWRGLLPSGDMVDALASAMRKGTQVLELASLVKEAERLPTPRAPKLDACLRQAYEELGAVSPWVGTIEELREALRIAQQSAPVASQQ